MNDFESQIYKMRDWLREEENEIFVEQEEREKYIEQLNEWKNGFTKMVATNHILCMKRCTRI